MSKFLTELEIENATPLDDGNWRLVAPLVYQSDVAREVFTVPPGYLTNLASVPRWPLVYWLTGGTANAAAALHDFLYTTKPVARAVADAVLLEASAVTGVPGWRRALMFYGVRLFGWSHWK